MTAVTELRIRAHHLGERLDLRATPEGEVVGRVPLTLSVGHEAWVVLFRYGAAVMVGLSPEGEREFLEALSALTLRPFAVPQLEELTATVDPAAPEGIDARGALRIPEVSVGHVQVVAEVLAKSTALAHYESEVGAIFDQVAPLVEGVRSRGRGRPGTRDVMRQLGGVLRTQAELIGRVEVAEKPDITWNDPRLDGLYERLAAEFELAERSHALTRKTDFIWESADLIINMAQHRQTLRVEWYIVILIVIEIVLFAVDLSSR